MNKKLRSSRGETLVEVLASVLVCALSITLLLGAVAASTSIDLRAQESDGEYYAALSKAERQGAGDTAPLPAGTALSVEVTDAADSAPGGSSPSQTITCTFYGTERLLSYAMTGGGG